MERKEPRVKKLVRKDFSKRKVIRLEYSVNGLQTVKPKKPDFKNAFLPYEKTIIDKIGDKIKEAITMSAKGTKSIFVRVIFIFLIKISLTKK